MQPELILALLWGVAGASGASAATRGFSITSFDRVRLEGPFDVSIGTGSGSSARADGPDRRLLDQVRLEVMGRTLVIRLDRDGTGSSGGNPGRPAGGIKLALTTPMLTGAAIVGTGTMLVDAVRGPRFDITLSGASVLDVLKLEVDRLTLTITGAGKATLGGRAAQVRLTVQGVGTIDAAALASQDAAIVSAGTSSIAIAASRTAQVAASGGGIVKIVGRPACTVSAEGSVDVVCDGPAARPRL